ncbi:LysR family transcriptional regulator [Cuneatibacter sp. NSJ-177]|uniref:LysR family transcriptional regulator n=1 Tax=Cuneatibacter sp. NSJ-177 TaxID=2931401 RepID=UPI001FD21085|nr:LysR family transcriptional regulator [Cuneatibacter sp. NSJ-177]MCJ7837018.1 LysR family transcriptional regulator [Cuneatibacter sp. NSJ-177]
MDLQQLIYFKRAAELGNISAAAREFRVVQSAVSTQIKNLEYELGAEFFERTHNRLVLNDNGRILYRHASEILGLVKDAGKELADIAGKQQKELTLSVETVPLLLPDIIQGFCRSYPDIKIRLLQYQKDFEMENLEYDLMLNFSPEARKEENSILIYEEEILLAVPFSHPLSGRDSVRLEELSGEAFIERSSLSELRVMTEAYFRLFRPQVVAVCDYPPMLNALISSGVGMAFLPRLSAAGDGEAEFALVRVADFSLKRWIYMKWRKNSYLSEPMQCFLNYAEAFFGKYS